MNQIAYTHHIDNGGRPVIACSNCDQQYMEVRKMNTNEIIVSCKFCDYMWEWNLNTLKWTEIVREGDIVFAKDLLPLPAI